MAEGVFPDRDHEGQLFSLTYEPNRFRVRGQLLAGGLRGCWESMRGDWKYLKEALGLTQHYNRRDHICHLCKVLKHGPDPGMVCTNFRRDAPHRGTLVDSNAFHYAQMAAAVISPLLLISGFCIWRVQFDHMHTHDLGTNQHMAPSVLKELVQDVFQGATQAARVKSGYVNYRAWCKSQRVKAVIGRKFVKGVIKGRYPSVSQNFTKAAAMRAFIYWLDHVCSKHVSNDHDRVRAVMVRSFVEADKVCRRAGRMLTAEQHETLCKHTETALTCYNKLATESYRNGTHLYKVVPKFHAATHVYDSRKNPRFVHCYPDEDMVGRLKRIYVSCHGKTAPHRALQRYSMMICLRWWTALHSLRGIPML